MSQLAGQTVRLRLATTDNRGPLRAGVDDIRFERVGGDGGDRVELLDTPKASRALDIALHRLTEADALAALSRRAKERPRRTSSPAPCWSPATAKVLLDDAWGFADRETGTPNTADTRFRIGSMNKMFTAVATLQLVEAGELALDEPIGTYLPDYPNEDVASKVTIRHLLTHTGGTGDFFGPEFDEHRLELRTHSDYVELFGEPRRAVRAG